ncbi:MAG: ankyrin repeat domain-containing protein [Gammaproteobacteria bacterium]
MSKDYDYVSGVLKTGTTEQLEELAELVDDFPNGEDDFTGRRWIRNAIDFGSSVAIAWMLEKKVDLAFSDDEGYPALLSAIVSERYDRYAILEMLLEHGAPTDIRGINDWTSLHMAAARNDVKALKLLLDYGADSTAKTRIDNYATPLEEARMLGSNDAVKYLEAVAWQGAGADAD